MRTRGLLREHASTLSYIARSLDATAVILAGWVAFFIRFGAWTMPQNYQVALLVSSLMTLIVFPIAGIYHSWRGRGILSQAHTVGAALLAVAVLLVIVGTVTKTSAMFSRQWMAIWFVVSALFLFSFRTALTVFLRYMRKRGWNHKKIVIVGTGQLAQNVSERLREANWTGMDIVAFFCAVKDGPEITPADAPVKPLAQLPDFIRQYDVDEVWLALPLSEERRVRDILHDMRHTTAAIRYVPDIFGFRLLNHAVTAIAGMPVLDLNVTPMVGINRAIKAIEDRVIAFLVLLFSSPLMAVLAIAVKLTSTGPVFYRQVRLGWNGKPFVMFKFRSMPVNAEQHTGAVWARQGESRATAFGAFLRKTSLDELPQFINVLRGEMSIVGPRPERPILVERFKDEIPDYMKKHLVKAGITGWAQVNGWRGDTDLRARIEHDLFYIENWSLWFDLKIIFLTLFRGFVHQNAY